MPPVAARSQQQHRGQRERDDNRDKVQPDDRRDRAPLAEPPRERDDNEAEQDDRRRGEQALKPVGGQRRAAQGTRPSAFFSFAFCVPQLFARCWKQPVPPPGPTLVQVPIPVWPASRMVLPRFAND